MEVETKFIFPLRLLIFLVSTFYDWITTWTSWGNGSGSGHPVIYRGFSSIQTVVGLGISEASTGESIHWSFRCFEHSWHAMSNSFLELQLQRLV